MEKLINLLNEYEESFIEKDLEEESDWIIEYGKVRKEYNWHLRFNNANTVQFPDEIFDYYALSKKYWFVMWLINHGKIWTDFLEPMLKMNERYHLGTRDTILMYLSNKDNPIQALISMLK